MRLRLSLLLVAGLCLFTGAAQNPRPGRDAVAAQQKFDRIFRYLNAYYVDEPDPGPLAEAAVRALLAELDPHSAYLTAEEMRTARESFDGAFDGIGIEFGLLADTPVVVRPLPGGPADRAGVRAGDRIVCIDTCRTAGRARHELPQRLRGRRGTSVNIEVHRPGRREPLHLTVVRDRIPLRTVDAAYPAAPGIGYIHVNRFGHTTMDEFRAAYESLGRPQALILDLRGNGGGLLEQALGMAEFFLPRGARLLTVEGRAIPTTVYEARNGGPLTEGPLAVLLDERSASASEIVAGAVQDWDRGVIVGRPSFGKGLVQKQFNLPDGSSLRLTIARYHTPSGRIIQRPYTEGDREEYLLDRLRRDTLPIDRLTEGAPCHRTLRTGRTVYGGGGIVPDRIVPPDTATVTPWLTRLVRSGTLDAFLLAYLDRQRDEFAERYTDAARFADGFVADDRLLDSLATFAAGRGIEPHEEEIRRSTPLLRSRIRIGLARRMFGEEAAIYIMNRADTTTYIQAMRLLEAWETKALPLLGYKK